jgi:pilus assembly protein CpaE
MIIDDQAENRAQLRALFEGQGLDVMADGRHGIAAHHMAAEIEPDIAFVAVEEPLARTMLSVDYIRDLRPQSVVVAYSSETNPVFVRRVMQSGVADLLRAPISKQELVEAIFRAVETFQRNSMARAEGRQAGGTVFSIVGQKGGIGKTTLATNLAALLAQQGHDSVILIDLDTRFGDVAVMMDLPVEFTAANAARSIKGMDRETFRSMLQRHASGAYVLPAPARPSDWLNVEPHDLANLIEYAAALFDYVILDTPGALDEGVAVAIEMAAQVVVITSPDLASIKNTNLLMAYMEGRGVARERATITLTNNIRGQGVSPADVSRLLELDVDFEVPFATEIIRGSQAGQPVVMIDPTSNASRVYAELASRLTGKPVTLPEASRTPSPIAWFRFGRREPRALAAVR